MCKLLLPNHFWFEFMSIFELKSFEKSWKFLTPYTQILIFYCNSNCNKFLTKGAKILKGYFQHLAPKMTMCGLFQAKMPGLDWLFPLQANVCIGTPLSLYTSTQKKLEGNPRLLSMRRPKFCCTSHFNHNKF